MSGEDIVKLIFEENIDVKNVLCDAKASVLHETILKYGFSSKRFLYLDYKGEDDHEIVNHILDYEFNHKVELSSQAELEKLGEFEYEYLPEKIRETNKILSRKGYGVFSFPTFSDFYALFIDKIENKTKLLQVEFFIDEGIPSEEKFIQLYI